jgi:hypothetical protein
MRPDYRITIPELQKSQTLFPQTFASMVKLGLGLIQRHYHIFLKKEGK